MDDRVVLMVVHFASSSILSRDWPLLLLVPYSAFGLYVAWHATRATLHGPALPNLNMVEQFRRTLTGTTIRSPTGLSPLPSVRSRC